MIKILIKGGIMQTLQKICLALTIVGALNWGLVGLFNFNLVEAIFGVDALLTNLFFCRISRNNKYWTTSYSIRKKYKIKHI